MNAKESMQQFVYDIADKDSVTTSFDVNSVSLSDSAKAEIRTMIGAVKGEGNILEILVISYSDKPYPKYDANSLTSVDRLLAKTRGQVVGRAILNFGGKNVKRYNMTEKTSWFSKKLFGTDTQIKNESGQAESGQNLDDAFYRSLGHRLDTAGGPGKVITVVRYEVVRGD